MKPVSTYENRLDLDPGWALQEGSLHFEEKSKVQLALHKMVSRLGQLNVPYALAGGMALFQYGHRRFTEGIDILVNEAGLKTIRENLEGRGYLPPFTGSKQLRDTEHGVRIEFLVSGGFPGDGKPKPIAFPDPAMVATKVNGLQCISLQSLIELKLASGMSNALRAKYIADVIALLQVLHLGEDYAQQLNPYVREKYLELWRAVQADDSASQ